VFRYPGTRIRATRAPTWSPRPTCAWSRGSALPQGYAAFVHPRSGLAAKHGVTIVNAPGTVDAGYRGEIKVTLLNTDQVNAVTFKRGDRIAQLVVQRVEYVTFREADQLPDSARGAGGFGSTGGHAGGYAEVNA
jgi:dUTP pyrophosphatase